MSEYVELTIEQGATFTTTVTVTDSNGSVVDLSDYIGKAQLKKSYYSLTATNFSVTVPSPSTGEMVIEMSADTTANLSPGRYVYDVILIGPSPTTDVTRIFEGSAAVTPGVTRNE